MAGKTWVLESSQSSCHPLCSDGAVGLLGDAEVGVCSSFCLLTGELSEHSETGENGFHRKQLLRLPSLPVCPLFLNHAFPCFAGHLCFLSLVFPAFVSFPALPIFSLWECLAFQCFAFVFFFFSISLFRTYLLVPRSLHATNYFH